MILGRRDFITLLGGAAVAWPIAARAQQTALPVIGFLNGGSPEGYYASMVAAFRQGLKETGFVEGENVAIDQGQYDRVPAMAAELVRRQVAVIVANTPGNLAAKAATTTIPIVFTVARDPVQIGLVASLARPGANVTGATQLGLEVAPKQLELAHELVPTIIAVLVNPTSPYAETLLRDLQAAAQILGVQLHFLHASADRDFDAVSASLAQLRARVLLISGTDPFLSSRSEQLAALAVRHGVPAISMSDRPFVAAGGLMSYGGSATDMYRIAGVYAGRILKGEKPADLPVQQSTKVELIINLKTAKALGLTIPLTLLGRADEVIE
jgi:putative ABC transport system substrate-binding protein